MISYAALKLRIAVEANIMMAYSWYGYAITYLKYVPRLYTMQTHKHICKIHSIHTCMSNMYMYIYIYTFWFCRSYSYACSSGLHISPPPSANSEELRKRHAAELGGAGGQAGPCWVALQGSKYMHQGGKSVKAQYIERL